MTSVSQAVEQRRSVRDFLSKEVSEELLRDLLSRATRAPSGGNVQPWKIHVVRGKSQKELSLAVQKSFDENSYGEEKEHLAYPEELQEPYYARRRQVGQQMYQHLGIEKSNTAAKWQHVRRTFSFFNAPVGLIITIDKHLEPIQWTDVGIFLQTFMLLAQENGLGTCAQGFWSFFPQTIAKTLDLSEQEIVICGMAVGYANPDDPLNEMHSLRAPLEELITFHTV